MTSKTDDLRFLLLDMISPVRLADIGAMGKLGEAEWTAFALMSRQHRLESLLHHRAQMAVPSWPVPAPLREKWARSYRRSAIRALSVRQTMGLIAGTLNQARVPHAFLKGAWLAWHAYEHPALRPMRDLDIIAPAVLARDAYAALTKAGFVPRAPHEPSIGFAMAHGKHLPGLVHPETAIGVEIHHRLLSQKALGDLADFRTDELLARSGCFGSAEEPFRCLAPTDTLLHLIVHAVYEHRLCNGPLVLSDIACLLGAAAVDWGRLWSLAKRGGWQDGARLVLGLVERYHGTGGAIWPEDVERPPERIMEVAALMMLQDHEQRGRLGLLTDIEATGGWLPVLGLALRRALPQPHVLAAYARRPVQARDLWRHYPGWAVSRLLLMTRGLLTARLWEELPRARLLQAWLRD